MPDSPAYLARDRVAYVGGHSFVLLVGVLALTTATAFFYDPSAPQYRATAITSGQYLQWVSYGMLWLGGIAVIVGLVSLWLVVEGVGHAFIATGIMANGLMALRIADFGFLTVLTVITVVVTIGCIGFRLWALLQATRLAAQVHDEMDSARRAMK